MRYSLPFLLLACLISAGVIAQPKPNTTAADSIRISELNRYWSELSRTVREGDFNGYKATYHQDAVCVFTTGPKKISSSIADQLKLWEPGFVDTKSGKTKNNVEFRFSQRVGSPTTAHETGIFYFTSQDKDGKVTGGMVHFESLLVKQNGMWLAMMEYQKSRATKEEWDALK